MPDLQNRTSRESAFANELRRAWAPYANSIKLQGDEFTEPNWDELQAETERIAQEHYEDAKRAAAVVLWLLFLSDIKLLLDPGQKAPTGREIRDEVGDSDRPGKLARDVTATSRTRWRDLGRRPTQEEIDAYIDRNFGRTRTGDIAATELTYATTEGESAVRTIMENRGLGLVAYWVAEPGACDVCASLNGKTEAVWATMFPDGPPSPHPSCRCHLRYVPIRRP